MMTMRAAFHYDYLFKCKQYKVAADISAGRDYLILSHAEPRH